MRSVRIKESGKILHGEIVCKETGAYGNYGFLKTNRAEAVKAPRLAPPLFTEHIIGYEGISFSQHCRCSRFHATFNYARCNEYRKEVSQSC